MECGSVGVRECGGKVFTLPEAAERIMAEAGVRIAPVQVRNWCLENGFPVEKTVRRLPRQYDCIDAVALAAMAEALKVRA